MSFGGWDLHRQDLFQAGPLARNTLVVLPVAKKRQQKVAVGNDDGILHVFCVKKGQTEVEWKSPALGREISRVVLQNGKDKLYVACGQQIRGFTRKGKDFLKIKTNLSETIQHLFVDENTIWTCGEYILNVYEGLSTTVRDAGFVMCPDRVHDLVCAAIAPPDAQGGARFSSVLACHDKHLRVYAGEQLYHDLPVDSPVKCLALKDTDPAKQVEMLFGMDSGHVGVLRQDQKRERLQLVQQLVPPKRRTAVANATLGDLTRSGGSEYLVGRVDGSIEVWAVADGFGSVGREPSILFETNIDESVRSFATGHVSSGEYPSLVVAAYSGKVLGFSCDPACADVTGSKLAMVPDDEDDQAGRQAGPTGIGQSMSSAAKGMKTAMFGKKDEAGKRQDEQQMKEKRFLQIRKEVEKLQDKVLVAREKYERENQGGIAVAAPCKVSHSFRLEAEESCYILSVECEHPIDLIAMRADVHMDLLDHGTSGVVMSRTEGPPNEVLVNYKFQEPTMRHEIRFRTIEGMGGTCSCFVVPTVKPKCAMLVKVDILPLSLHDKVQESQIADRENIPVNELRLSGQFSLADMNMWLASCLDVPTRPEREDVQLWYKNTFTGSMLECRFSAGQAVFRSDSISTVAVLKEIMTKEATDRKIHLKISCDVNKETFPFFLNNLHPKLAYQHSLTNKVQVVEPLKEISLQENGDTSFLSPELALVLEKHEELLAAFEEQPRRLLFLYNIVCGLYRNKWKMLGHANVDHRIPDLEELLHAYSLETLLQFFEEPLQ